MTSCDLKFMSLITIIQRRAAARQEADLSDIHALGDAVVSGEMTPNAARAKLGLPPLDGGNSVPHLGLSGLVIDETHVKIDNVRLIPPATARPLPDRTLTRPHSFQIGLRLPWQLD